MRRLCFLLLSLLAPAFASAQTLSLVGPARDGLLEGDTITVRWEAEGVESVSLVAQGIRTPRGRASRGRFQLVVAEATPPDAGRAEWTVPWMDAASFTVKAKGYDAQGNVVATDERAYGFRPAVLARRTADGLYLDLHRRDRQRLYVQKDGRIQHAYLTSSSSNYLWRPPDRSPAKPHDHAGVFRISEKRRRYWSSLFQVTMPFAMRYHQGHFIHATSERYYDDLGGPASAGCNRLTRRDAEALYKATAIGTRVEVIGPERKGRFGVRRGTSPA